MPFIHVPDVSAINPVDTLSVVSTTDSIGLVAPVYKKAAI